MSATLVRYRYDTGQVEDDDRAALVSSDELSKLTGTQISIDRRLREHDWGIWQQIEGAPSFNLVASHDSVEDAITWAYNQWASDEGNQQ